MRSGTGHGECTSEFTSSLFPPLLGPKISGGVDWMEGGDLPVWVLMMPAVEMRLESLEIGIMTRSLISQYQVVCRSLKSS